MPSPLITTAFSGGLVSRKSGRILGSSEGNYDDYTRLREQAVQRQWTEYENYTSEKRRLPFSRGYS